MSNLAELEAALSESRASWKLVVGHHPVRSNGIEHGGTPELRRENAKPLIRPPSTPSKRLYMCESWKLVVGHHRSASMASSTATLPSCDVNYAGIVRLSDKI